MNCLLLKGGLGNQLFILAFYIYLKKKLKIDILLEDKIGFLLDFKYHRVNELDKLPSYIKNTQLVISLFNLLVVVINKFLPNLFKYTFINYLNDSNNLMEDNKILFKNNKIKFIDGYFQDFRIIKETKKELLEILKPKLVKNINKKFIPLISRIKKKKDSVALCIRFYEESVNPSLHLNPQKKFKTFKEYNQIIKYFESKLKNPHFFIFIQEENGFTEKLEFKSNYEFITHKKGFIGSWNRLYCQSLCVHHIFNNSTFYYWGAFISSNFNKDSIIFISDNFRYKNIYNPKWFTF